MTVIRKAMQAAAGAGGDSLYVDDLFSTYLYTGNGTARTITTGIDLDTDGGMLMFRNRTTIEEYPVWDSTRLYTEGVIRTNDSSKLYTSVTDMFTGLTDSGFTLGADATLGWVNTNTDEYAAWSFRKAEKFMDIVTYTGTSAAHTISHDLGAVPALIIIKRLVQGVSSDAVHGWIIHHKDLTSAAKVLLYHEAGKEVEAPSMFDTTYPTSTVFTVGANLTNETNGRTNIDGSTFVAYLFASEEAAFGAGGDESVNKCGTFTTDASGLATVSCGWEPQYLMVKGVNATETWKVYDNMRGMAVGGNDNVHTATTAAAESLSTDIDLTADGFEVNTLTVSKTYVYMAIRRPMKTPTAGTEVYQSVAYTGGNGAVQKITTSFPVDMEFIKIRNDASRNTLLQDRLRGKVALKTDATSAEINFADNVSDFDYSDGILLPAGTGTNEINGAITSSYIGQFFKRATGFMDVVAYTGTGGTSTQAHNLGVVPELMIFKRRDGYAWNTYVASSVLASAGPTKYLELNDSATIGTDSNFLNGAPTSSLINTGSNTNQSTKNYIAYLFATLDGISKVGTYTGTGAALNVDCGFSAGARFALIKRTDAAGNWFVYDSVRGIVAGADPYLNMNSTAAEDSTNDDIDPLSSGFSIPSGSNVNTNGGTYIYLAIA